MADDTKYPPPLRSGSQRAQVYNDGLVVYLYDLAHREGLKTENAWEKINSAFDEEKPDKALKQFLTSRRVASYELQQDDSVLVDVSVGPPLTPAELKSRKGVKWHKAQTTLLNLPSGKLRVESANSCLIGAEDTNEEGVTIDVPAGEYLLTLHRIDWDSMEDPEGEPAIVGETITLTPVADAKVPKTFSALMRFPIKKSNTKWLGAYTIEGNTFKGQVIFPDFWEFICLNLDRAAFETLSLGPGSVLDVEALGRKFTIFYLVDSIQYGIMQLAAYRQLVGNDRTTAEIAREPELALGVFVKQPETQHEILCCMRINAKKAISEKTKTGKWMKTTAVVRPQKLEFTDRNDFGKWKQDGPALHATVLLRSNRYMTLNLDSKALEAAGIRPGDTISIRAGGQEQKALFVASPAEMAKAIKERSELEGDAREAYMALRVKTYDTKGAELDEIQAQLRRMFTKEPPLVACLDQYWLDKAQPIFLTTPMAADKESIKLTFPLGFPVKPGEPAVVSKA